MSDVIKVALPGYSVSDTNPSHLAIDSSHPSPKINKHSNPIHRGLMTLVLNGTYPFGTTTLYTFPHGYNYTPMVWATISDNSSNNIFGFQPYINGFFEVDVRADPANVYFLGIVSTVDQSSVTPLVTLNISYAVFADNGANS